MVIYNGNVYITRPAMNHDSDCFCFPLYSAIALVVKLMSESIHHTPFSPEVTIKYMMASERRPPWWGGVFPDSCDWPPLDHGMLRCTTERVDTAQSLIQRDRYKYIINITYITYSSSLGCILTWSRRLMRLVQLLTRDIHLQVGLATTKDSS